MTDLPNSQPRPEYVSVSGLAVASMVCGICGIFTLGISSLVGLFLGYRARRETRAGHRRGDGMAITGIVLGWLAVGFALLVFAGTAVGLLVARGSDVTSDLDTTPSEMAIADPEASPSDTTVIVSTQETEDSASAQLEASAGYIALSAGGGHSCAIRADQTLTCWGDNRDRQADAPSGTYTSVSAGRRYSCAIRTDRTLACWGDTIAGPAVALPGIYTAVSAGDLLSCAVRADGTPVCWDPDFSAGVELEGAAPRGIGYTAVSVAYHGHVCAIRSDGTLFCFGDNEFGQTDVPDGTYTSVSAGELHSCAVRTDRTLMCWGNNDAGQADAPDGTFAAVSAGSLHSCAVRTDGALACWGATGIWDFGQADAPSGTFTAVAAGELHSCAIRADGTLACWGQNELGQTDAP